jgi:hypothetical protein
VHIATNPPGARAVCVPLDEFSGEPLPAAKVKLRGVTPGKVRLAPGEYLVVVDLEDYGFHEVYRRVPADGDTPGDFRPTANWTPLSDGSVALPAITIVPTDNATRGMEYFSGGRFSMGDNKIQGSPKHDRTVEGYWLDRTEVTVSRYQTICGGLPNSFHAAKAGAANRDYPITHVTFDQALNYAELSGKRLMTEAEYEFAATVGGTQRYPWGDSDDPLVDWTFGPVGEPAFDRLSNAPSVMGLYSNVAEWTDSRLVSYLAGTPIPDALRKLVPLGRVVRGGTADVVKGDPDAKDFRAPGSSGTRFRLAYTTTFEFPGLGFRCARSGTPRFLDD